MEPIPPGLPSCGADEAATRAAGSESETGALPGFESEGKKRKQKRKSKLLISSHPMEIQIEVEKQSSARKIRSAAFHAATINREMIRKHHDFDQQKPKISCQPGNRGRKIFLTMKSQPPSNE